MGRDIIYDSAAELVKEYRTRDPIYIKLAEMNKPGYHFDLSWGDRKLFG